MRHSGGLAGFGGDAAVTVEYRRSHAGEPLWETWERLRWSRVPPSARDWLRDPGSLTRRLQLACGGGFHVRLLRQAWGRALPSERRRMEMWPRERVLVREVELLCRERIWVYARTLIPARSLQGPMRQLTGLGERPLGAVLFAQRETRRGVIEGARLLPGHRLFAAATGHLGESPGELWGRRTLFRFAGRPLLVNEVFLPEVLEIAAEKRP
jgi:chorismate lyase